MWRSLFQGCLLACMQTVRIWDMTNGKEQFQFKMGEPCRACNLSLGEQMLAFTTDAFMGRHALTRACQQGKQHERTINSPHAWP
eukprot:1159102-Pelagomonas_calceolata.AAC.5